MRTYFCEKHTELLLSVNGWKLKNHLSSFSKCPRLKLVQLTTSLSFVARVLSLSWQPLSCKHQQKAGVMICSLEAVSRKNKTEKINKTEKRSPRLNHLPFSEAENVSCWEADGNLITYGWIFLVNTLLRNLLSNAAIKLTSNNLVVIGAGLQMLIFALNVTMLICFLTIPKQKLRRGIKFEILLKLWIFQHWQCLSEF